MFKKERDITNFIQFLQTFGFQLVMVTKWWRFSRTL